MFQKDWIKQKLTEMGYRPKEFGENFRMSAIYRGGSTNSSLSVNCNSGFFTDFGNNNLSGSFADLIKLTIGSITEEELKKIMDGATIIDDVDDSNSRIEQEKLFDKSILDTFLPAYDFYLKKGIKEEILKKYYAGFVSGGEFVRRITFPIFNAAGQIHGLSGRRIDWKEDSNSPKWKHKGGKNNWIYPVFIPDLINKKFLPFLNSIREKKELILVESIGDSLALTQMGYANNMVTFGLTLSPKQLAFVATLNINKIIIATNNDNTKKSNHGCAAAMNIYLRLFSEYVDSDKLIIALPLANDFSDMITEGKSFDEWYNKKVVNFDKIGTIKYLTKKLKIDKLAPKKDKIFKSTFYKLTDQLESLIGE